MTFWPEDWAKKFAAPSIPIKLTNCLTLALFLRDWVKTGFCLDSPPPNKAVAPTPVATEVATCPPLDDRKRLTPDVNNGINGNDNNDKTIATTKTTITSS